MTSTLEDERVSAPVADGRERVALRSASLPSSGVPETVLLAPWGEVQSTNGTFVVDESSARTVVENFEAHGTDLPIDYEHQSLGGPYASPSGQAPAAGWIRGLRAVSPDEADGAEAGLFATVEWTEAGREKLAAREYRYLSPVVLVRKQDRRVVGLHSAALTNKPAIVGIQPIVNRAAIEPAEPVEPVESDEELPADADGQEVVVSGGSSEAVETIRLRLGLAGGSDHATVLLAADDRLGQLMSEAADREAAQRVEAALRAGKLTAPQHEWAFDLALRDVAAFDAWLASAPVVVRLGRTEPPDGSAGANGATGRTRVAVINAARSAFRAEPGLASITSESAWIRVALREEGLPADGDDLD